MTRLIGVTLLITSFSSPTTAEEWSDEFDKFSLERWTTQTNGLRLVNPPPPDGITTADGVLRILEPLRGARLTSRDRFLYGTLEVRVRISPMGLQYVGFMSRSPWAANTAMCMTMAEGNGWELVTSRDKKGGHAGFGKTIDNNSWTTIKINWQPDRLTLDVNGKRIGEITDQSRIPATPTPLILDAYANNRLEVDYLRITNTKVIKVAANSLPPAPPKSPTVKLVCQDWSLNIDGATGVATKLTQESPTRVTWTPSGSAAVDLYVREFKSDDCIRFKKADAVFIRSRVEAKTAPTYGMRPINTTWQKRIIAELRYESIDGDLVLTADFKSLEDIAKPVEIGLGVPFSPRQWERIAIPRLPWLALVPDQPSGIRLPFLADPNDATITSDTGSWVHYPFGILQNETSSVFWGCMDIGQRIVLAPGNNGCGPAVTLAPKKWAKGETKRLSIRLRVFPRCTTEVVRWYLSNCTSRDPLTHDLFPVGDWTPRTLPDGGIGMPDIRISRVNKKADPKYFDRVTDMLKKYHVPNLWFGSFHNINGTYPISGKWVCPTGLDVSAVDFKNELARLKKLGLRPCLYTFQFIVPELHQRDTVPSNDWILHDINGNLFQFDSYRAGEKRFGAEWFTKELGDRIGTDKLTWANVDFGRKEVREFYFKSLTSILDYYEPSGICFDYGWGVVSANATYSPANPTTSQPHARLRVQADVAKWIKANHPDMLILINDCPGTPSQLFANCQLVENSDVMSDLDIEAGRALGSSMSSMDYFTDHNESRWSRVAMSNLSKGCSIGMPFWIPMNGPDDYVNTWQALYDFSAKTTAVPIVPSSTAVTSDKGEEVKGTAWAKRGRQLASAMDHRQEGNERLTTVRIKLPNGSFDSNDWKLIRLSSKVQAIPNHRWRIANQKKQVLELRGPLRPGEMILLEPADNK